MSDYISFYFRMGILLEFGVLFGGMLKLKYSCRAREGTRPRLNGLIIHFEEETKRGG